MKSFYHSGVYLGAVLCITAGAVGFILLRFLPPSAYAAWILPLLSLLFGFLLLLKLHQLDHALLVSVLVFAAVWVVSQLIWPRTQAPAAPPLVDNQISMSKVDINCPPGFRAPPFNQPRALNAPTGTRVSVFRSGLEGVRWLAFSPKGELFASRPRAGEVVRLIDDDRDGYAEQLQLIASGLDKPHGLAFDGPDLIVAGETTLYRLVNASGPALPEIKELSRDIPGGGGHWTRSVVLDDQRRIYVSIGSSCNACQESDARRASVRVFPPEGGQGKPFAVGLRNTVGLAWRPGSSDLWGSDNGRDMLGDDLPADEINLIRDGLDYGWPFCHGEDLPDPRLGSTERCDVSEPPAVPLPAHSAPLGIEFGQQLKATRSIQSALLVAYHGSWNRSEPTGYKVVGIPFDNGNPSGSPFDLVSGWLSQGNAWGRPVSLAVGPRGELMVSDDRAAAIYRIEFPADKRSD